MIRLLSRLVGASVLAALAAHGIAHSALSAHALPLSLLAAALIGGLFAVPLMRRIRALQAVAARMAEGDFRGRYEARPDEALAGVGASLNRLADRVDRLLSDQRDLMRTVAHEVRAPVARMRFRIEMLQSPADTDGSAEAETRPPPEHDAPTDGASRAEPRAGEAERPRHATRETARHARGLVGDLAQIDSLFEELLTYVGFDEFDQTRPELQPTSFVAMEAVEAVVAQVSEVNPAMQITVEGDPSARVLANRKLFERAVSNVVRNAVAYGRSEVRVQVRAHRSTRVVDVQDDGPGIPEADRPRVLQPFVRLDPSNQIVRGTGLGLAIVGRIMRLHDGALHIVSAPRGGTSCQLVWPAAPPS